MTLATKQVPLPRSPPVGLRPAQAASPGSNDAQGIAQRRFLACAHPQTDEIARIVFGQALRGHSLRNELERSCGWVRQNSFQLSNKERREISAGLCVK